MVPVSDLGSTREEEGKEENLNGTFPKVKIKISEDMSAFLAECVSWCERKQGADRSGSACIFFSLRSGYYFKFSGSAVLTSSPLPLTFPRPLGDRSIRKMTGLKFYFHLFLSKWSAAE